MRKNIQEVMDDCETKLKSQYYESQKTMQDDTY